LKLGGWRRRIVQLRWRRLEVRPLLDGTTTLLELKSQVLGELWEWDRLVLGE
jgi:hypothetical protein